MPQAQTRLGESRGVVGFEGQRRGCVKPRIRRTRDSAVSASARGLRDHQHECSRDDDCKDHVE